MPQPADWDPDRYRRFEMQRTQPAIDLLSRVPNATASLVVDLGCGPGNSTELLVRRFPEARVVGLDSSPAMVATARQRLPQCDFMVQDLAAWQPENAPDVLFANAVLQWLPDHARLLPILLCHLAPGGTLAVQMPDNLDAPSHRAMRAVAQEGPWAARLQAATAARTVLPLLERYYDLLAAEAVSVEVWRTTYHHPLPSAAAILDMLRSTGLRPFLDPLDADEQSAFLALYESKLDKAYPVRADGGRLLGFERIFLVATRA
ncbi:trans-aconitate 2-methyltransferase [Lichenihabitans sp. Uapishka_5]|uniref:trans-aconitate 2-methyltransferase n=1 Tax=Lichenihabitans sp. Uapishka_5 TaxID=3037302 RepID=UPI0029E7ED17|nr:trans-aconitate 2-methyltransferase [Lichenihabitans sp. Uapishka_5]MDX7952183.1 trans-aconitate 2-methyltransferase [Lichenihabitans sp. Uapishka_5]